MLLIFFSLTTDHKERLDTLFAQQHKKMYGLSYHILGSQQDAEDAVSDAFLKIIDNIEKIKELPCHKTVPYCVVIVRNCCITILRRRKKAVPIEQAEQIADDGLVVEEAYFRGEDAALLESLMAKLSPTDRQLLRLHYTEGMSYREIGAMLNITEAAVRKREQRALDRLRKLYIEGVGEA